MNILIVKLSAIGDVVHTLPSLSALRKLYPHAHITWVVEEDASDLIADHPYLDRVLISYRKRWIKSIKKGHLKVLKEVFGFIRELRNRRYDVVIDFHGLLKSSLLVLLAPAKRKLGYESMQEFSGLFLKEKISEDMNKHAVCRYLDLVHYLENHEYPLSYRDDMQISPNDTCPERGEFIIPIRDTEEKRTKQILAANGLVSGGFVALNTSASWKTKLWEEEAFARLCDRIIREQRLPVIFTGTDKKEVRHIQRLMSEKTINLAGETSLQGLACLYRQAALVVTTDSGPMHIAAAVGTQVVALFGPTDPVRTGPYGRGHRVISADISCRPCFRKKCISRTCMLDITVDEVFRAIDDILQKKLRLSEAIELL